MAENAFVQMYFLFLWTPLLGAAISSAAAIRSNFKDILQGCDDGDDCHGEHHDGKVLSPNLPQTSHRNPDGGVKPRSCTK